MVDLGMSPIDALKSATSSDVELLGMAQKTGTLELADSIAMPGDSDCRHYVTERVSFVMKEGRIIRDGPPNPDRGCYCCGFCKRRDARRLVRR
jgi:imidazolonepropionase-like amidohydrolase